MREPAFWRVKDLRARASAPLTRALLTPIAMVYRWAGARRIATTTPHDPGVPVICVGNLTLGGAGKTPVVAALRHKLSQHGRRAASLSRGYGGRIKNPARVDPEMHAAADVGDEPLMLAASGESWIGQDRPAAATAMAAEGVDMIVMDDGHQNPSLAKTLSFIVIDAGDPFGNGLTFPKGPLREFVSVGLARADVIVLMGDGPLPQELRSTRIPVLRASLAPRTELAADRYVAFAGIGRPQKFFDALVDQPTAEIVETIPFGDHHPYTPGDIEYLTTLAAERDAQLITTEKDHVRLPKDVRTSILSFPVTCVFEDETALDALLNSVLDLA
ncbi:MAG: tetraacyldisaccharide 4'-kinase [Pseudomonadota bacterium]